MSERDIDRILDAIAELRREIAEISKHGCAKSEQHADHEVRLRSVETVQAKAAGALSLVAALSSLGTVILVAVGKWILGMMFGKP